MKEGRGEERNVQYAPVPPQDRHRPAASLRAAVLSCPTLAGEGDERREEG
jgi:hypothetical protein